MYVMQDTYRQTVQGDGYFGAAVSAPLTRRWTTGHRVISAPFPNFFLFFELWRKKNEASNSLNAVKREPVETRVFKPNASEAYKPKQCSYRKTNLKKSSGARWSRRRNVQRPNSSAETGRRNVPDPTLHAVEDYKIGMQATHVLK